MCKPDSCDMENPILITWLNDFIFCPASIYFHNLYGEGDAISFQESSQINGSASHRNVDSGKYSSRKDIVSGISVYSSQFNIIGKIDIYDNRKGELIERKKKIKAIYDGYVFQIYAQYFALKEMGYHVQKLILHSMDDNKNYPIPLPEESLEMYHKFQAVISAIHSFDLQSFHQDNLQKCAPCIYEPLCDSSLLQEGDGHAQFS